MYIYDFIFKVYYAFWGEKAVIQKISIVLFMPKQTQINKLLVFMDE